MSISSRANGHLRQNIESRLPHNCISQTRYCAFRTEHSARGRTQSDTPPDRQTFLTHRNCWLLSGQQHRTGSIAFGKISISVWPGRKRVVLAAPDFLFHAFHVLLTVELKRARRHCNRNCVVLLCCTKSLDFGALLLANGRFSVDGGRQRTPFPICISLRSLYWSRL